jgi:hypothetical protein
MHYGKSLCAKFNGQYRMDSRQLRWEQFQQTQRVGLPAPYDPTAAPACTTTLRIRTESNARDSINSRAWDFFHATPPTQVNSHGLQTKESPVHMDMNPTCSRKNTTQYRNQQQYIPDPERDPARAGDLGLPPLPGPLHAPQSVTMNPFLQRLDAGGADGRNIIREMRAAVVEDNRERDVDMSRMLASRQFYDRWLPQQTAADAAALQAYELLRPKQDDWRNQM